MTKRLVLVTAFAWSLLGHCQAQEVPDLGPGFTLESVTPLDATVVVGGIKDADITAEAFLISDQIGQSAYLFDPDGSHRRTLSIEECIPGRIFLPLSGRLARDRILVASSGSPVLTFATDGDCRGVVNPELRPAVKWDTDPAGRLFVLNGANSELRTFDENGTLSAIHPVRTPTHPELERRWEGGGVRWTDEAVFLVGVVPDVLVSVSSTGVVTSVRIDSGTLTLPSTPDLPSTPGPELFSALRALGASASIVNNLFVLNDELLLITFFRGDTRGFVLVGRDGKEVASQAGPYQIIYAEDNRLYLSIQPEMAANGEVPNPVVVSYRYHSKE